MVNTDSGIKQFPLIFLFSGYKMYIYVNNRKAKRKTVTLVHKGSKPTNE